MGSGDTVKDFRDVLGFVATRVIPERTCPEKLKTIVKTIKVQLANDFH